jgi:hypothetical protein
VGGTLAEIEPRHLDPACILWATLKLVDVDQIPDGTTTVRFQLNDHPAVSYWMLLRRPHPELCTRSSGYVEDLTCHTDGQTLTDLHPRRTTYVAARAVRQTDAGRAAIAGPEVPHLVQDQPVRRLPTGARNRHLGACLRIAEARP